MKRTILPLSLLLIAACGGLDDEVDTTSDEIIFRQPTSSIPGRVAPCGNGQPDPGEACDDRNTRSGDGCSSTCQVETGFSCRLTYDWRFRRFRSECDEICGDQLVVGAEACDDGNADDTDFCSSTCREAGELTLAWPYILRRRVDGTTEQAVWNPHAAPAFTSIGNTDRLGDGCAIRNNGTIYEPWGIAPPFQIFSDCAVSSYNQHGCGIHPDGTMNCFGTGTTSSSGCGTSNLDCGQAIAPQGTFADVTAYPGSTCALTTAGTVQCWGWTSPTVPTGSGFSSIDMGSGYDVCALTTSGTLECNNASYSGDYRDFSVGLYHRCLLQKNGTLDCSSPDAQLYEHNMVDVDSFGLMACGLSVNGDVICEYLYVGA